MIPSNALGTQVRALNHAIRQYIDRELAVFDLTGIQSFILRFLSEPHDAPVCLRDIETKFHLTHPTVSGILRRLEAKDFVITHEDPLDRRRRTVCLTEKGLECQKNIARHVHQMEQRLSDGMTPQETEVFLSLLKRAEQNLREPEKKEASSR